MYCDECLDQQPVDADGLCENCAENRAHRAMLDAMSEEEYVRYKAALLNAPFHSIIKATSKKAA